jgi:hypothetical protein
MENRKIAREFALKAHGDQKYGDRPYSYHLDAVTDILRGFSETAQIIGYLHDVLEDTATARSEIQAVFGPKVTEAVALLTDEPGETRRERKEMTMRKLAAIHGDLEVALIVKAADRLANIRACHDFNRPDKLEMYAQEHASFARAVFRPGICDSLWCEMAERIAPRPIPACYWVIPGRFLAGEYPRTMDPVASEKRLAALIESGIRVFIDLTQDVDNLLPYAGLFSEVSPNQEIKHERFPIKDRSIPESPECTGNILDTIDAHLAAGRGVYLHCWGGIGRTGTVVGCWLGRHGQNAQVALRYLGILWHPCSKSAFRRSPETVEQEKYLMSWPPNQ